MLEAEHITMADVLGTPHGTQLWSLPMGLCSSEAGMQDIALLPGVTHPRHLGFSPCLRDHRPGPSHPYFYKIVLLSRFPHEIFLGLDLCKLLQKPTEMSVLPTSPSPS